jgi:hypothetical protein
MKRSTAADALGKLTFISRAALLIEKSGFRSRIHLG